MIPGVKEETRATERDGNRNGSTCTGPTVKEQSQKVPRPNSNEVTCRRRYDRDRHCSSDAVRDAEI